MANTLKSPELTKSEFAVLQVLWKQQPLSVREVHDRMDSAWAYTTTKTVMDRMAAKGLLARETVHGVIVYRAQVGRVEGMVQWVRFMAERVLEVEYDEVLSLFSKKKTYSAEELSELRQLLAQDDKPGEPKK